MLGLGFMVRKGITRALIGMGVEEETAAQWGNIGGLTVSVVTFDPISAIDSVAAIADSLSSVDCPGAPATLPDGQSKN
jgi:hypothetical protein